LSAHGHTSCITGAPRCLKNNSIVSISEGLGSRTMPRPKVCVQGERTPSNIANAPATSIHCAPEFGSSRALASTNLAFALPSACSSRSARARSAQSEFSSAVFSLTTVVIIHQAIREIKCDADRGLAFFHLVADGKQFEYSFHNFHLRFGN